MPTLNKAISALKRHLGFPESRSRVVARRLREAGHLPAGGPGTAPEVSLKHVVDLLIAVAADARIHATPDALAALKATTPGGVDMAGAPNNVVPDAWVQIMLLATGAAKGEMAEMPNVEFVSTWPEVALHYRDHSIARFQAVGALSGHWQDAKHRKSIIISGVGFRALFKDLFN